jgi:hypothetical protein
LIDIDFIGRFENLQEDFNKIANRIGINYSELPHLLKRNNAHYTSAYDDKTRSLVNEIYKDEIDYFNFKFGE